jgi:D-ribulokinase
MELYLGIDFGTSGARAIVIDAEGGVQAQVSNRYTTSASGVLAEQWQTGLWSLLDQLPKSLRERLRAVAIDGTSSTVLLCDGVGQPITAPILYSDDRGKEMGDRLRAMVPPNHPAGSSTSSFAKLLWWSQQAYFAEACFFLHQADWLAFLLHGKLGVSDYHNSLKLGYDVERLIYPDWLVNSPFATLLPKVLAPGSPVAPIQPEVVDRFGFRSDCFVCTGTTDSIAAFLASDARSPGEAVTSLGSTLVLKLLSRKRVEDGRSGVYSHRLGNLWLVGGASNTGGAVLKHFFEVSELETLSAEISVEKSTPLDYYPLLQPGERFPVNDPALPPRLEPRPDNAVAFLHGLLEGMARIEALGYQRLQELGADPLTRVYTAGGGAVNHAWTTLRSRHLKVPVLRSTQTEAAYGTARLALQASSNL